MILCYLQAAQGDITAPAGFNASNILGFNLTQFIGGFSGDLTLIAGTFFRVAPDANGTATTSAGSSSGTAVGGTPTATTASGSALSPGFVLLAAALVASGIFVVL